MNEQIQDTKDFLQNISDQLHRFIGQNFPDSWVLFFQIFSKILLLALIIFVFDFVLKNIFNAIFKLFFNKERFPVLKSIYQFKITNSVSHIFALLFGGYALFSIFYRHPKSFTFLERSINFAIVLVLANMAFRALKAFEYYTLIRQDFYKNFALRTISSTVRTIGLFIFSIIGVYVIFGISGTTIVGSLGAITAVLVLVFRDTILGFVTGLHVATSKNLKVGDWIAIPKYSIEGNIEDINLLTTKIKNFDKTISTIPTYDLLSTEIRNYQVISDANTRRIKKSIVFNMKSLKFVNHDLMQRLKKINLIKNYLLNKEKEIEQQRKEIDNPEDIINGSQLTNIGVFRKYVENYLKKSEKIDHNELVLVRQLQSSPEGLPLEVYCFATEAKTEQYETIQSDIFDHLLSAAKEFELEIVQKV